MVISWREWEEQYKPQQDTMLDFPSEIDVVDPYHIWTVVDNNPNSHYLDVIPGLRVFNRLGFFTTEIPWSDEELIVSNDPSYR